MPSVKGGVWTNIEDEILKAAISKYGLNQWARVSSLLARKTSKQCKARWDEWLDPSIRKIEWSREEDEKLLHLAKLMPTQWRTIAPIVGRTANQCLERYNKLLDEAQIREDADLGLAGPGGEASAPTTDDVRKLRPGEVDPDPESKPARPDTIDLDEDEKEMLSEARARLANTQGKKAKRKARERQLEESRRVAALQKRRELKMSGINIKIRTFKKGEMDYNADIPFERPAVPGFYDTTEEKTRNEQERNAFDPRKKQLAIKRKGGPEEESTEIKRKKTAKPQDAGFAAAVKAAQAQKIREAEQMSKRRALNLPAPQVNQGEIEEIVKIGLSGGGMNNEPGDNQATRGLITNYNNLTAATPIRTPRAPQEEDRVANEVANIRALNDTQSALLGGDNADLIQGSGSTGFDGIAPSKHTVATPNPMATPLRQQIGMSSPTPLRTPRDNLSLNLQTPVQLVPATPRDLRLLQKSAQKSLLDQLATLPKPKETDWELELPEQQAETVEDPNNALEEDAAVRDARERARIRAAKLTEFKSESIVIQKQLPRPSITDLHTLLKPCEAIEDPIRRAVAAESAMLIAHDACKFGRNAETTSTRPEPVDIDALDEAKSVVAHELAGEQGQQLRQTFVQTWIASHRKRPLIGLDVYDDEDDDDNDDDRAAEHQLLVGSFDSLQHSIVTNAQKANELEKKLAKLHGGYLMRARSIGTKTLELATSLQQASVALSTNLAAQVKEHAAMQSRLDKARAELALVSRREREEQQVYRQISQELADLRLRPIPNGVHG